MSDKVYYTQDMLDEAADMCDRYARKHGFDRKSPRWEKLYKRYLEETLESLRPMKNNPQVSKRVVEAAYPYVYDLEYGFIGRKLGNTERSKELMRRFESAVNNLNAIFLEVEMGMKTKREDGKESAFDIPGGADEGVKHEVWLNQYKRMASLSLLYGALYPFFLTKKSEIDSLVMKLTNVGKMSSGDLHKIENRVGFSKTITEKLREYLYNINFVKYLFSREAVKEKFGTKS